MYAGARAAAQDIISAEGYAGNHRKLQVAQRLVMNQLNLGLVCVTVHF